MAHHQPKKPASSPSSSWEPVEKWYNDLVGQEGHYYHQHLILPHLTRIFGFKKEEKNALLDLACGQGILARQLPPQVDYLGVDISPSLIRSAKEIDKNPLHKYLVGDITKHLTFNRTDFTHAAIVLAVQNLEHPLLAFQNIQRHLKPGGQFVIVMNHPCFRIPRQSSWQVDQRNKIQFRRLDRYLSPLKIPIQAKPSQGSQSETTWSFHHPISAYTKWLHESGFMIEEIEEWCSPKVSTGGAAKMENRSREEFPLFLAFIARKTAH